MDFDDLMARLTRFKAEERVAVEHWVETCRMMKQADEVAASAQGNGEELY